VQQRGVLADHVGDGDGVAGQQALVAMLVGDDLDLRRELRVALDEPADGAGQTWGVAARSEERDLRDHG